MELLHIVVLAAAVVAGTLCFQRAGVASTEGRRGAAYVLIVSGGLAMIGALLVAQFFC